MRRCHRGCGPGLGLGAGGRACPGGARWGGAGPGPDPRQPGLCWQENVSLADILSLRDRGLGEREAWAVCLECCLAMRSVAHAALFHTLCITPDTLAFNSSGSVCFMEQLSGEAPRASGTTAGAGVHSPLGPGGPLGDTASPAEPAAPSPHPR